MGDLLKKKRTVLQKYRTFFTPLDKGSIKHLTTIFNYLQCFVCKFDYLENAVTITTKLPDFVIFISIFQHYSLHYTTHPAHHHAA